MYMIKLHEGPGDWQGTMIHSPYARGVKCKEFNINLVLSGVDVMEFTIIKDSPAFNLIKSLQTLISVQNYQTKKDVFTGRVLDVVRSMDSSGSHYVKFNAESRLAYLNDSFQDWKKFQPKTIQEYFTALINHHNSRVEAHKRFKIGRVTVSGALNSYEYIEYGNTYDQIEDKLLSRFGGYLIIRDELDGMYIDYLANVGQVSNTPIRLRTNLQDYKQAIDPTNVISKFTPLGATLEEIERKKQEEEEQRAREEAEAKGESYSPPPRPEPEEDEDPSKPRLTINSVNGNKGFLLDENLIAEFGLQEGFEIYDDIYSAEELLDKGKEFMKVQKAAKMIVEVTALDLSKDPENLTFEEFEIGNRHRIGMFPLFEYQDTSLQIIEININSSNLHKNKLKLGERYQSLSQYQLANRNIQKQIVTMNQNFRTAVNRYRDGRHELESYRYEIESLRKEIGSLEQFLQTQYTSQDPVFPVDYTRSGINFWVASNNMYYGAPRANGRQHAGFDIGGGGSKHPIHAVQDGVVSSVGWISGLGNTIKIKHTGDQYHSLYGHLDSTSVSTGDTVRRGQQIAIMGATGGDYAIHLHFELSETGEFHTIANTIDPAPYLGVTRDNYTTLENPINV